MLGRGHAVSAFVGTALALSHVGTGLALSVEAEAVTCVCKENFQRRVAEDAEDRREKRRLRHGFSRSLIH